MSIYINLELEKAKMSAAQNLGPTNFAKPLPNVDFSIGVGSVD